MGNIILRKSIKYSSEIVLTFLVVTFLSFMLIHLSPVDPATAYAKRSTINPTMESIETIRVQLGLDKPFMSQYGLWLKNAFRMDFGKSLVDGKPVIEALRFAIPITFNVVILSSLIQVVAIILLGCLVYFHQNKKFGFVLRFMMIAGISVPGFYIASVYLDIFAVKYNLMSIAGNQGIMKFLHPAICLAIPSIMFYARLLVTYINKEMDEDYVFYARARGLSESRILLNHSLPHSIMALIPSFMQSIGLTMAGAAIIERIFSLPGIGYLIIDSVINRDSPMIHVTILYLAFVLVMTNILSDICQGLLLNNG